MNPYALFTLQTRFATLAFEAQTVMALRLMAMAGFLPARAGENDRMWSEKGPAMAKAMTAGATAALAGKRPDQIASAAMAPISRRVKANRRRLMK
jgi:hypothetical protein